MNIRTIAIEALKLQNIFEANNIHYRSICWKYQRKIRTIKRKWLENMPHITDYIISEIETKYVGKR